MLSPVVARPLSGFFVKCRHVADGIEVLPIWKQKWLNLQHVRQLCWQLGDGSTDSEYERIKHIFIHMQSLLLSTSDRELWYIRSVWWHFGGNRNRNSNMIPVMPAPIIKIIGGYHHHSWSNSVLWFVVWRRWSQQQQRHPDIISIMSSNAQKNLFHSY